MLHTFIIRSTVRSGVMVRVFALVTARVSALENVCNTGAR